MLTPTPDQTEPIDTFVDLHVPRDLESLRTRARERLTELLPLGSSAAVVLFVTDGARVELSIGHSLPWAPGAELRPGGWRLPGFEHVPMAYGGQVLGELVRDAELDADRAADLERYAAQLAAALVNLKLNAEASRETDHYCASLQAFEEGVVLFQERDPATIGARFLALAGSLLGTRAGALYILEEVGDPGSGLRLDQLQGLPESLLDGLRTYDGRWWPATVVDQPAGVLGRDERTGEVPGLDDDALPEFLHNIVHCPLHYHGVDVGLALAFNASPDASLPLRVERARRLGELGAALFHRLSLEQEAIEHREFATQLSIASTIQQRLIPTAAPATDAFDCAWRSAAAQLVGGDYLDLLGDAATGVRAIVADVSGHGIDSALLMASCRAAYRAECFRVAPEELLAKLNDAICDEVGETGMFITAAIANLAADGRSCKYASAGHNPTLVYRAASGVVQEVGATGPSLGVFRGMRYEGVDVALAPGDVLLLYTDGLVEATDARDEMFGEQRLEELLVASAGLSAQEILAQIETRLDEFLAGRRCEDDVSISVVKVR